MTYEEIVKRHELHRVYLSEAIEQINKMTKEMRDVGKGEEEINKEVYEFSSKFIDNLDNIEAHQHFYIYHNNVIIQFSNSNQANQSITCNSFKKKYNNDVKRFDSYSNLKEFMNSNTITNSYINSINYHYVSGVPSD